jgi:hypothetical protein
MNLKSENYIRVLEIRIKKMQEFFDKELAEVANKWTEVEDGLPEDGQKLVAINKRGGFILMQYSNQLLSILFPKDFTHWMPLPETPKDVNEVGFMCYTSRMASARKQRENT